MSLATNPHPWTKAFRDEVHGMPEDAPELEAVHGRDTTPRGSRTRSGPGPLSAMHDPARHDGLAIHRPATLRQQARKALRDAILGRQFRPGQRLTESMLCRVTGVSRTVVREVLRHLESEGLVEYVPGRGAFVADFSAGDIRNCYEIHGAMQERAARTFAQRAGDEAIAKLRSSCDDLRSAGRARETNRCLAAINSFHDVLLNECTNPLIPQVVNPVDGRIKYLRAILLARGGAESYRPSEFSGIVDAVERRDAEGAAAATRRRSASECEAVLVALSGS